MFLLFVQILLVAALLSFVVAAISIAPWVPTKKSDLLRVHTLAKLKKWETFFELWCGDGRVSHYIAEHNPQANVIGIELCFPLYIVARVRQFLSPQSNLTLKFGDGFTQDLSGVQVVYVFWVPESMKSLQKKFERELKTGARILSYVCDMEKWKWTHQKHKPTQTQLSIYVHEVTQ